MTDNHMPLWEQRLRAPQIPPWTLSGASAVWPRDASTPAVVMANISGRIEAHVYTPGDTPAPLTQITDRPQGTLGAVVSPTGDAVLWFNDTAGDEVGRWVRQPLDGSAPVVLAADQPAGFMAGIAPCSDGGAVIGYLGQGGTTIVRADPDGSAHIVAEFADPGEVVAADDSDEFVLVAVAPGGDWLHMGTQVIRVADGAAVAQRVIEGSSVLPVGFAPGDADRVLLIDDSSGQVRPAVWKLGDDSVQLIEIDVAGDAEATWYPDGSALLITVLENARHTLQRLDLVSGERTVIPTPRGCISAASVRPNGEIHALVSSANKAPMVYRLVDREAQPLIRLPSPTPPPTVEVQDVFVNSPAGRIHALVRLPPDRKEPHPTVVNVHGGPTFQDYDLWHTFTASLVDLGYATVNVNYRGSTGYGAEWRNALKGRLGFIELEDVTAVLDHLVHEGTVDPHRVSIAGGSWGGFVTLMALGTQPERWRSGVALVPVADQVKCAEVSPPFMQAYLNALIGGTMDDAREQYVASSPISYVANVRVPVFLSAGVNDPRCPVEQVDTYADALRAVGGDVNYHRIDTGHAVPDVDTMVNELRLIFDFLVRTNPPG
jgi:dipeptidyl aminopeptidase/acylaminoacyl peptidase